MSKKIIGYDKFIKRTILVSILGIVLIFSSYTYFIQTESITKHIESKTSILVDMIFTSLYTVMKNGGGIEQLNELEADFQNTLPNSKITIHKKYTDSTEDIVKRVFKTKKGGIYNHNSQIDYVKPILYKNACIQCHTEANVGDVASVVQVEHSYWDISFSMKDTFVMLFILLSSTVIVLFVVWYSFLNKYFIHPISSLSKQIDQIESHDDLNNNIYVDTPISDIKHVESIFNKQHQKLSKLYVELEEISNVDQLTKIYNRKMFEEMSISELEEVKRYQYDFTLLSIDLNKFKYVNDTFGHIVGDKLLIKFTNSTSKLLRNSDLFFRVGGDEFIIFLPHINTKNGLIVIDKIKEYFATNIFKIDTLDYYISASYGIAQYGEDGDNIIDLMKVADIRMYEDKKKNKD